MNPGEEERLRELLEDAVSGVEPRRGLDSIQSRTKVRTMSNRPWIFGAGAAVVATAATIAAFAVLGGDTGTTTTSEPGPAGSPSATVSSGDGTPSKDEGATPAPDMVAVPVYYVGQTGQGPRLYREFHQGAADDKLGVAVQEAVGRTPDDPDYSTPWPDGTTADASMDGVGNDGLITITVTSPDGSSLHDRPAGMSAELAGMAVQQLVYTAQAATQTTAPVQLMLDGGRTDQLLGEAVSEPLARADETSALAQVWIINPAEGAEVRSGFEVSGIGAFFEANVTWELRQGDEVVDSGFTTAEECCRMAPYSFTVDAAPGSYTLVVADSDMSGGGEGFPPFEDSKNVTVTE